MEVFRKSIHNKQEQALNRSTEQGTMPKKQVPCQTMYIVYVFVKYDNFPAGIAQTHTHTHALWYNIEYNVSVEYEIWNYSRCIVIGETAKANGYL